MITTLSTKPLLITLEGVDGSGKSTQARLLAKRLREAGRTVEELAAPGTTALGILLRKLLLRQLPGSEDVQSCSLAELLLFAADRAQLYAERIVPALTAGHDVVCDRGIGSALAYQVGGSCVSLVDAQESIRLSLAPWLEFLDNRQNFDAYTFVCDVPPAISRQRLEGKKADYWEAQPPEFHKRVRDTYNRLHEMLRQPVVYVDANQSLEAVHNKIWIELLDLDATR